MGKLSTILLVALALAIQSSNGGQVNKITEERVKEFREEIISGILVGFLAANRPSALFLHIFCHFLSDYAMPPPPLCDRLGYMVLYILINNTLILEEVLF